MIFLILIAILFIIICAWNFLNYLTFYRYIDCYPGPKALPIIGNAHQLGGNPIDNLEYLFKWWKEYGCNIFRIWITNVPYIFMTDPKDVEAVLSSNTLLRKADTYDLLHPWLGQGLLTSDGIRWHKHRKIITPSFHFKILVDFLKVMNENSIKFVEKLKEKAETEEIFDIQKMIQYCTLDIICETAMGTNFNSMDNPKSSVVTAFQDMCYTVQNSVFSPIKRNPITFKLTEDYRIQQKAIKTLKDFTSQVIEKRRKILIESSESENSDNEQNMAENEVNFNNIGVKPKKALLDNLLTAKIDGRPLTDTEIFEEVSTFMFGGHHTVTAGIAFSIYLLSKHQDIQENIYQEQCKIFRPDEMNGRNPTYQEILDMKFMELFIKEVERLYPSVPIIARYCEEEFNLNGRKIPKGSILTIFIMAMGYNEKYFKDPYKVNVHRFDLNQREKSNAFEYVPFSAGPRNCIGQKFAMLELKSVLSRIVRHFQILPPVCNETINQQANSKIYEPVLASVLTLKSENGIHIRLRKRKKF